MQQLDITNEQTVSE